MFFPNSKEITTTPTPTFTFTFSFSFSFSFSCADGSAVMSKFLSSLSPTPSVQSQSAVASIDLGSKCLKVVVVNLKPGQAPISIAINEMSKWKTSSLVAFHSNSQLIGEESLGLLVRYPTKVYSHLPILLSKPFNYPQKFLRSLYLSYDITPDETRDVVVYKTEEEG
ncbi:Heat shock 70 kDa protein 17 [Abeliophyllum distichum]|uniref:Heat shock 70 kDa protein 17 n=1 Tax=Abeliophyllum distichum TaxID=126358 RepID=A0ABD1TJZ4_9LAMI